MSSYRNKKKQQSKKGQNKNIKPTTSNKRKINYASDFEEDIFEKSNSNNNSYDNEEDPKEEYVDNEIGDSEINSSLKRNEYFNELIKKNLNNITSNYYDHGFNIIAEEIAPNKFPDMKKNYSKLGEENYRNLLKEYHPYYKPVEKRKRNNDSNEEDIDNSFNDNKNKKKKLSNNIEHEFNNNNNIEKKKFTDKKVFQLSMDKTNDIIFKGDDKNDGRIGVKVVTKKKIKENKEKEDTKDNNNDKNKEKDENYIEKINGILKDRLVFKYENVCLNKSEMKQIGENLKKNSHIFQFSSFILLIRNQENSFVYISLLYDDKTKSDILKSIKYSDITPNHCPNLNLYDLYQHCDFEKSENYLLIKGEKYLQDVIKHIKAQKKIEDMKRLNNDNESKNMEKNMSEDKNKNDNDNENETDKKIEKQRVFKWVFGGDETIRKNLVFSKYGANTIYEKTDLEDKWPNYNDNEVKVIVFPIKNNYDRQNVENKLVDWCKKELFNVDTGSEKICAQYEIFFVLSDINFDEYFKDNKNEKLREIGFDSLNCAESLDKKDLDNDFKGKEN